jgi:hypothetical protein
LRLRTARGMLRWPHAQVLVGQEIPLFSPQNPVTPAALGTPEFAGAGNLWLWLPQVRATGEVGSRVRGALQLAVLAPVSGDPAGPFDTDYDAAERSHRPFLESRVRARWGGDAADESDEVNEVGCAGHLGWLAVPRAPTATADSLVGSHAVGCDARVHALSWLELRGEVYSGQGMKGLGGGAIGQGLGPGNVPIRNTAGWAQLNVQPTFIWSFGAGCGVDEPNAADLAPGARLRNEAIAAYSTLRPAGPITIGLEVRRLTTTYAAGPVTNNHVNLALGFEF